MSNISVILPVHELDETTKTLFANAIESVKSQSTLPSELVIVVPKGGDVFDYMQTFDFGTLKGSVVIAENDGETDFCSQINYGVSVAKSDWFSILEFDDEYLPNWFNNVVKYREAYSDVDIFMPIIVDVNKDNQFIDFTNNVVWAHKFSDELGYLDNDSLIHFQNFNTDGFVMKKSVFEENGGLKPSIKLTFLYEFLLRMTFRAVKTMVIPKFGYRHVNERPNSLFLNYRETINPVEAKWWLAQAKKEFYFGKDREIAYQEETK